MNWFNRKKKKFSGIVGPDIEVVPKKDFDDYGEVIRLKEVESTYSDEEESEDEYSGGDDYNPIYGSTVNKIKERGYVICGVYDNQWGFSERTGQRITSPEGDMYHIWEGFDGTFVNHFPPHCLEIKIK